MQSNSYRIVRRTGLWLVMLLYVAVLTKLILFKQSPRYVLKELKKDFTTQRIKNNLRHSNFSPLHTVKLYMRSNLSERIVFANIGGNILGFVPFGFLLPLLFRFFHKKRRIIAAGLLFSFGFETAQLITGLGRFDIDDLLLNTVGALLGFLLLRTMQLISQAQTKNPAVSGIL
jgi:glycopeptide antibiotics resistance protein